MGTSAARSRTAGPAGRAGLRRRECGGNAAAAAAATTAAKAAHLLGEDPELGQVPEVGERVDLAREGLWRRGWGRGDAFGWAGATGGGGDPRARARGGGPGRFRGCRRSRHSARTAAWRCLAAAGGRRVGQASWMAGVAGAGGGEPERVATGATDRCKRRLRAATSHRPRRPRGPVRGFRAEAGEFGACARWGARRGPVAARTDAACVARACSLAPDSSLIWRAGNGAAVPSRKIPTETGFAGLVQYCPV